MRKLLSLGGWALTAMVSSQAFCAELSIYAVNGPVGYFAHRLAGDTARVVMPSPKGVDPAFWEPSPEEIAEFQSADLILLNGADYAKWVKNASLPRSKTLDTGKAFSPELIKIEGAVEHSHGGGDPHSHAGVAFTTWLDFGQATAQASAIAQRLSDMLPEMSGEIDANLEGLRADLLELDGRAEELGRALGGQSLIVSHPIYDYFARAYGLNLISMTFEPDQVPDDGLVSELDAAIEASGARYLIWEDTPIPEAAAIGTERGLTSLVFRTGNDIAPDEDLIALIEEGLTALESIIAE